MSGLWTEDPRDALRAGADFDLAAMDRRATPGFSGDKTAAATLMKQRGQLLSELQERLYAIGRVGTAPSVLVVVQGLDTAGKGGIARHVMGMVDPQGVALRSFGVPTAEERSHHYLWRINNALPRPGQIGLFDRSHYEDVLVVRVDNLVEPEVWEPRFDEINNWEKDLVDGGTKVLKFALMASYDEQARRLMERLDRPDKRWKFSLSDLRTRAKFDDYQAAYADVFRRTSTDHAPWYVLPADRKWFPRLAVTEILARTMIQLDLKWPVPTWDPSEQRARLAGTMTPELFASSLAGTRKLVQDAINESVDVKLEATELRTLNSTEPVRRSARAVVEARRAELEADLEVTLENKHQILENMSPELAAATAAIEQAGRHGAKPKKRKKPSKRS